MFPAITRRLDRFAIRTACRSVNPSRPVVQSEGVVAHPDYFADFGSGTKLDLDEDGGFRFASPIATPWPENNFVSGRLYPARHLRAGGEGRGPAVILLHGWNGEQGYRYLFPLLARRFRWMGMTAAMIELPYHGGRKPRSGGLRNFLSGDIAHMMAATRQAIADIRAMIGWLQTEGYGPIALWGVSLGAWLGGLVACVEDRLQAAVLLTPVPNLEEAIENLAFCRHIRASMEGRNISAAELNLSAHRPRLAPENILIVQSLYDLFASPESVEELWRSWGRPEIWRVKHGHISVLFSVPIMSRTGRWLSGRLHLRDSISGSKR